MGFSFETLFSNFSESYFHNLCKCMPIRSKNVTNKEKNCYNSFSFNSMHFHYKKKLKEIVRGICPSNLKKNGLADQKLC